MRARLVAGATLLALAAGGASAATARAPVSIGVAEREYHISAYRHTVKPGPLRFNVTNMGEDTHDLYLRGPHGYHAQGPIVGAGQRGTLAVTLRRPGTYTLLCTLANHAALGMRTKIVVAR